MRMRSDAKLVELARRGSRDAAAELFTRHWRAAWRAAYVVTGRRELADDVAQDAFERAFGALSRFDERRPFGPWLHRIVVNRCLDLLRTERRLVGGDTEIARLERRSRAARRGSGTFPAAARCCRPALRARLHTDRDRRAPRNPRRYGQLPACPCARRVARRLRGERCRPTLSVSCG